MVDKGSLRSNRRSNSTSQDKDTKETSKKPAAPASKPTRSSSRRSKKAEEGESQEAEGVENGAEDVEMKDDTIPVEVASQIPLPGRKDDEGDTEMDVDEKSSEGEKKDSKEDPAVTVSKGTKF